MSNYGLIRFIRFVSRFIGKLSNAVFISSKFNSSCRCRFFFLEFWTLLLKKGESIDICWVDGAVAPTARTGHGKARREEEKGRAGEEASRKAKACRGAALWPGAGGCRVWLMGLKAHGAHRGLWYGPGPCTSRRGWGLLYPSCKIDNRRSIKPKPHYRWCRGPSEAVMCCVIESRKHMQ